MKCRALLLLIFSGVALASTTSTPTSSLAPGQYVLHNPDNTIPAPFTEKTSRFDTLALCDAAARSLNKSAKYKCDMSTGVSVTVVMTSTCADERAPRIYLSLVDLPDGNGAKGWELPEMEPPTLKPGSDTDYMPERDWLYVHNPKWPDGFPNCWVRGWEDPTLWRQNPKADPGKVFMERLEPGMTEADVEMPPDTSYTCWPGDAECVPPAVPPT